MKEKSVLFFTYWYPNKNNKSSGIFIKRHAQALGRERHVVVLALSILKGSGLLKQSTEVFHDEAGLETHQVYLESRFNKLLYVLTPLHYFILKKYIRNRLEGKYPFGVIHSNILFPCALVGHFLAKRYGWKHIITEHWSKVNQFFTRNPQRYFGRKAFDQAQAITCVSQPLADMVKQHTVNTSLHIVPNVVDPAQFYYDPSAKRNDIFTFITISNWASPKNPFYFLEALKALTATPGMPRFRLVLVGTGYLLDQVKKIEFPFEIEYKTGLDADGIREELNKSHVFLHGSEFETFSVVIAEALMCGTPCVVSPVGIASEVINENNGFVTDNTPESWKHCIQTCCNKPYNRAQIASQLSDRFGMDKIGKLFSEVYRKSGISS